MKRLICLIALVAVMIGAAGLAGAEASSKSPTGRVSYKESMNLKGPVRTLAEGQSIQGGGFAKVVEFSKDGFKTREISLIRLAGQNLEKITSFDSMERLISVLVISEGNGKKFIKETKTIYDDLGRRFERYETIESESGVERMLVSSGTLNEKGQVNAEVFEKTKATINYKYDSRGNLICREEGSEKYEYEYDRQDRETMVRIFYRKSKEKPFEIARANLYTYNSQGEINSFTLEGYDHQGILIGGGVNDYKDYQYDHQGNWIGRTVYMDGEEVGTETRKITYWE